VDTKLGSVLVAEFSRPSRLDRSRAARAARRSIGNTAQTGPSEWDSDEDVDPERQFLEHASLAYLERNFSDGPTPHPIRMQEMTEDRIRAHQLIRGQMSTKRIASQSAIQSMQSVDINELDQDKRSKYWTFDVPSSDTNRL
jgi:hypothetical protein